MRSSRNRFADPPDSTARPATGRRWANGLPVLPLRLFLAALFCFAGYAKLSYPGFFDPASPNGFRAAVQSAKNGTPIGGALGPLADHPFLFGHVTAYAEIAIGLGLLVGLLARVAALGGMVLTTMILLSIDWSGVKQYTGSSGWFTAVDLAVAAALSVFLLGGAGPFALDNAFIRARERNAARDDDEPSFRDTETESARRRLQGEPVQGAGTATATEQWPVAERSDGASGPVRYRTDPQDEEYRDDPEPEPNSLWTQGRRDSHDHSEAELRRGAETGHQGS